MMALERSAERDAAIVSLLPLTPHHGWSVDALREAAGPDADLLFSGGPAEMVETYCDLGDRWMEADAVGLELSMMRAPQRVRAVIAARLERNGPFKEAVRRGLGVLALPGNSIASMRCTARTVDAIWHAAGDTSVDFSWYSKRAILAGVYGATLLYWLRDDSDGDAETLDFLDRRLAGVGRIGRARKQVNRFFRSGAS